MSTSKLSSANNSGPDYVDTNHDSFLKGLRTTIDDLWEVIKQTDMKEMSTGAVCYDTA